ncbi:MAG: hypothetical protein FJW20_14780 [Acidimicrobiia bacterium]|nr:hypothetical protein [Acidimicrobiia bacterium]
MVLRGALYAVFLCLLAAHAAELRISVTDASTKQPAWARLEVHSPDGKLHQPAGAIMDRTARARTGLPYYPQSFLCKQCTLDLPPGRYRVIAERGPEYERLQMEAEPGATLHIPMRRWTTMRSDGWYSADFHLHRPIDDLPTLADADDLNFAAAFTMWNRRNLWKDTPPPANPIQNPSPFLYLSLMNAEDERGGGAWMLHHLPEPIDLEFMLPPGKPQTESWHPPGIEFIRKARAWRKPGQLFPWFDCEKPIWWEVPVVMALAPPDSFGLLHNHFNQYGILDMEAWGRPRDQQHYPGIEGFAAYSMELYYRYLNLGFRIPPSAGSASGVLPNPPGYNRIYAKLDGAFSPEKLYAAIRDHRHFVTNGPMLDLTTSFHAGKLRGSVQVQSREPLSRIELIANGKILRTFHAPGGARSLRRSFSIETRPYTWFAARAFTLNPNTVRLAHSSPIYLPGSYNASSDAAYFLAWIDQLIANTTPERLPDPAKRGQLLSLYREARAFYAAKVSP